MASDDFKFSASALILDILSVLRGRSLDTAGLRRAGHIIGIEEHSIKVALARLVKKGQIEKESRGLYRLNPHYDALTQNIMNWYQYANSTIDWQHGWLAVSDSEVARRKRPAWRLHRRALEMYGFQPWVNGLYLRPYNLPKNLSSMRQDLFDTGLGLGSKVFELAALDTSDQQEAMSLWPTAELEAIYTDGLAKLEKSATIFNQTDQAEIARETLVIGHQMVRAVVRDPLLPEAFVNVQARSQLIEALYHYQVRAIRVWQSLLTS